MIDEIKPLAIKLSSYMKGKLGFQNPPRLFLRNDINNSKNTLGKTAHYDPEASSVTVFISGRHPKDVLRSLAHELVHHQQNERGDFSQEKCGDMTKTYAQDNEHLRNMEKEAYLVGNMCFRDWEDSCKFNMSESKFLKENKKMNDKITKNLLKEMISKVIKRKFLKEEFPKQDWENNLIKKKDYKIGKDAKSYEDIVDACLPGDQQCVNDELAGQIQANLSTAKEKRAFYANRHKSKGKKQSKPPAPPKEKASTDQAYVKKKKVPPKKKKGNETQNEGAELIRKEIAEMIKKALFENEIEAAAVNLTVEKPSVGLEGEGDGGDCGCTDLDGTPEKEENLYEARFQNRDTLLFNKLVKKWTK